MRKEVDCGNFCIRLGLKGPGDTFTVMVKDNGKNGEEAQPVNLRNEIRVTGDASQISRQTRNKKSYLPNHSFDIILEMA